MNIRTLIHPCVALPCGVALVASLWFASPVGATIFTNYTMYEGSSGVSINSSTNQSVVSTDQSLNPLTYSATRNASLSGGTSSFSYSITGDSISGNYSMFLPASATGPNRTWAQLIIEFTATQDFMYTFTGTNNFTAGGPNSKQAAQAIFGGGPHALVNSSKQYFLSSKQRYVSNPTLAQSWDMTTASAGADSNEIIGDFTSDECLPAGDYRFNFIFHSVDLAPGNPNPTTGNGNFNLTLTPCLDPPPVPPTPPLTEKFLRVIKFNDLNGDGFRDSGEPLLPNWEFDVSGVTHLVENPLTRIATDLRGTKIVKVIGQTGDTVSIDEVAQPGWVNTTPDPQLVTLNAGQTNVFFGNRQPPPALSIMKFIDTDGNGVLDDGETLQPGWEFDVTGPGGFGTQRLLTDRDGGINLQGLPLGNYSVTEILRGGWTNTKPLTQAITIGAGEVKLLTFGNQYPPLAVDTPEPSSAVLGGLGVLGLLRFARRQRKYKKQGTWQSCSAMHLPVQEPSRYEAPAS